MRPEYTACCDQLWQRYSHRALVGAVQESRRLAAALSTEHIHMAAASQARHAAELRREDLMLEAFNTWFRIGLLLYGLIAGLEAVVAFARGRPVWLWFVVADTAWHAGVLGLAAAGIAWLASSPDLVPPLVAQYGTGGALAVGVLWGALVATIDQGVFAVVWDSSVWRLPTLVQETWEHRRAGPPDRRWRGAADQIPVIAPPIDTGPTPDLPDGRSLRKGRRRRKTAACQSADDLLAPGTPREEQDPCS